MEVHQVIKIILREICFKFFKDSRLHQSKGSCIFRSYMYYYVYLRIKASFWFSPKIWLVGKKNKSYQVLSFDLNLKDNPKQTDTTPSHNLKIAKRRTNRQREKRRGKRKTRPKVKPSQKSKTEQKRSLTIDWWKILQVRFNFRNYGWEMHKTKNNFTTMNVHEFYF